MTALDPDTLTAIRERWKTPVREDFSSDFGHAMAMLNWNLRRGSETVTDVPLLLSEVDRLQQAASNSESGLGIENSPTPVVGSTETLKGAQFANPLVACVAEVDRLTAALAAAEGRLERVRALAEAWGEQRCTNGRPMLTTANVVDRLLAALDEGPR